MAPLVRRLACCRLFFFFQAEDGIRDLTVTGVQTCALPISTESVIACISVPLDVHCCAIARVYTSMEVVIELTGSRRPLCVVPVTSIDWERCIRSVSPTWGRICSSTGCALPGVPTTATNAIVQNA